MGSHFYTRLIIMRIFLLLLVLIIVLVITTEAGRRKPARGKGKPTIGKGKPKPGKVKPKPGKVKPKPGKGKSKPGKGKGKGKGKDKGNGGAYAKFAKFTKSRTGGVCWWDITREDCAVCKRNSGGKQCGFPMHNYCYKKTTQGCPQVPENKYTLSTVGYPCFGNHSDTSC